MQSQLLHQSGSSMTDRYVTYFLFNGHLSAYAGSFWQNNSTPYLNQIYYISTYKILIWNLKFYKKKFNSIKNVKLINVCFLF